MDNSTQLLLFIISEPVGSPTANEVAYRLADRGVRTWIGSLAPGGELNDAAMEAMRSSAAALLIFDGAAAGSRDIDRHLLVARQTGKPIIPLRVQAADEGFLRQELLDARWIDWSSPDQAIDEIERRARDAADGRSQPAHAGPMSGPSESQHSGVQDFRKPRIQVLQSGAAGAAGMAAGAAGATAFASSGAGPGAGTATATHPPRDMRDHQGTTHLDRPDHRPPPPLPPAAASAASRGSRSRFTSPTFLLIMLALAVLAGAVLYNLSPSRSDSGSVEREVAGTREPTDYAAGPRYDDGAPAPVSDVDPDAAAPAPQPAPEPADEPAAASAPQQPVTQPAEPRPAPAPQESTVAAPAPRPPEPAPAPAREPEPAPAAAPASADASSAAATVQAFYSALGSGDGASAAQLVVPGKRQSGPLSGTSLTRYYSSFRRPLRVRRVTPVDANTVRVAYDYVLSDGRLCQGEAAVNVVQSGNRSLVNSIRTRGPC